MPPKFLPIRIVAEQAEGAEINHEPVVCGEWRGRGGAAKSVDLLEVCGGGRSPPEFFPRDRIECDGNESSFIDGGEHDPVAP